MWQWRLVLSSLLILIPVLSFAAPTGLGPTSSEEASILWKEALKAIEETRYQDAVNQLERIVDRYPASLHFIESHLLLGKSYFELGNYPAALKPIQAYVSAVRSDQNVADGKILLAETQLQLKKYHEVELLSLELEKLVTQSKLSSEVSLHSKILQSEALLGLKHYTQAWDVIGPVKPDGKLLGRASHIQLKSKIWSCEAYPNSNQMEESEARDQVAKRGLCLLESLLLFQKVLDTGDEKAALHSATEVDQSFQRFQNLCSHPPLPSSSGKIKRTAKQLHHYKLELVELLNKECKKQASTALDLLSGWKTRVNPQMAKLIDPASKTLQTYSSRNL